MNINFIDIIRDDFENLLMAANSASVQRAELGFVNLDCDLVKSMVGIICIHALDNIDIFTKEQSNSIINLINIINYG